MPSNLLGIPNSVSQISLPFMPEESGAAAGLLAQLALGLSVPTSTRSRRSHSPSGLAVRDGLLENEGNSASVGCFVRLSTVR